MNLQSINLNRSQIYLLFYKPKHDDPFQNRLVSYFDGPFCHVEMAFPRKYGEEPWEKEIWGSSIFQGETVFFKPKTYKRDGYVSYAIEVTNAQYHKIKSFCRNQMENKIGFSKFGMYAAYFPITFFDVEGTFCSKHVTEALQHVEVDLVFNMNPNKTTPSKLYKYLMSRAPIHQVVPAKLTPDFIKPMSKNMISFLMNQKNLKDNSHNNKV